MRIYVKGDREIKVSIPSGLVLNGLTASMAPSFLEQYGVTVTPAQARHLVRALNAYRRTHPDWVLVEVLSKDGEAVEIKL